MKLPALIVVLVIISLGGFFLLAKSNAPAPSASLAPGDTPTPTIDVRGIKVGNTSYKDAEGIYTFSYPLDYKLSDQTDGKQIRVYKTGPTQQGQTEMYDGVILVFETVDLSGQTLSKWVDGHIKTTTADGTSKLSSPKKMITIKGYPGFRYGIHGLGDFTEYVLQKDNKSNHAVIISVMVADPQKIGFQKEVDKILSTFELHK
jgi:hypothetical protein